MWKCVRGISCRLVFFLLTRELRLILELLGLEVDRLNTVQFSNHTGYGSWTGKMLETAEVSSLLEGLRNKGWIKKYDVILSGYMRDKGICQVISDLVDEAGATWVCDPVLGDYPRGLYVPEDLVEVHRDISCKKAAVLTPNQFEAECLTGKLPIIFAYKPHLIKELK